MSKHDNKGGKYNLARVSWVIFSTNEKNQVTGTCRICGKKEKVPLTKPDDARHMVEKLNELMAKHANCGG